MKKVYLSLLHIWHVHFDSMTLAIKTDIVTRGKVGCKNLNLHVQHVGNCWNRKKRKKAEEKKKRKKKKKKENTTQIMCTHTHTHTKNAVIDLYFKLILCQLTFNSVQDDI